MILHLAVLVELRLVRSNFAEIFGIRKLESISGVVANIYLAERMASAEREPVTGVWPSGGLGGRSPPEAEKVLRFGHAMKTANLPYNSLYFGNWVNRCYS